MEMSIDSQNTRRSSEKLILGPLVGGSAASMRQFSEVKWREERRKEEKREETKKNNEKNENVDFDS